jgi:hypothetical protein
MSALREPRAVAFNPNIALTDPATSFWLAQVTLRLRRELTWCWHQRSGGVAMPPGALPAPADPVQDSLDLVRFQDDKIAFFATDVTARYLSQRIAALVYPSRCPSARGTWDWIARELDLTAAAQFVLACALAARADAALAAVCAACHNDAQRPWPTAALAQRLWDDPLAVAACIDTGHPLFRHGLLTAPAGREALDWHQPLEVPAAVARALFEPERDSAAALRVHRAETRRPLLPEALPVVAYLRSAQPAAAMQVVPLQGPRGSDFDEWAHALAQATGHGLAVLSDDLTPDRPGFAALATVCWMRGDSLLLPEHWQECYGTASESWTAPVAALPLRWYLPITEGGVVRGLPATFLTPAFTVPLPNVQARGAQLAAALHDDCSPEIRKAIPEAARRFRLAERALARVGAAAATLPPNAGAHELFSICRGEARIELDTLANAVTPRFQLGELVLPPAQARQVADIAAAMTALGRVHHDWGMAKAWNESGLSVLFCGPPGTGKTMAAEALAGALDLPMYRVDLSQVVNKYIGETEKNLRRIFDAAEASDCVLFFDEADALFGKRTEVKDSHDRFANIEISYLLERMDRFKGLAVLASNRRKDLDDAFTRRLRYIVEFPIPGAAERERIWRQIFSELVDTRQVDFRWLAQRFELAGGHIRSAAFNACLQAAALQPPGEPGRVAMADVLTAVKRELQKMNRVAGREQFGHYASQIGDDA